MQLDETYEKEKCYVISVQMKATGNWVVLGMKNTREEAELEGQVTLQRFPLFKAYKVEYTEYQQSNEVMSFQSKRGIEQITPKEIKYMLESGKKIQFIDVREKHERKNDLIPGALGIEVREIPHKLGELKQDIEYIVYCTAGYRSPYVCEFLLEKGYKAKELKGGLMAWRGAGFLIPIIEKTLALMNKMRKS